ncbi:helix-turn-helix transcriptional regulator [Providencia rettgeri]|uniref:Uncharacterized protein n=1 Tax=Providencia rettgeri TaxID=587 RepID=A0A379FY43_PRORE|nr:MULTISPECIES: helix-turn-helix transcriptional regulator [Providencia]ELR5101420.1 helix-turn-helix transcriptional regulator [Providencia rettgeri]ELR5236522.1 helix-turn-helix transcriptional regulator [Providencia rettgeri]EMC2742737.1 helix-turn-helix transcriptional regulator [Providencia rettgeri]EMD6655024.1 helix-turn-helix transcriptional regulator [Providencia rettgeri]MBJ9972929.1 helix-turn-helix transcriptional regulator [Providencia rettgeri]
MSISLGEKIRMIREAENLTRADFCSLTGIPEGTQKFYETGRQEISGKTLPKITTHPRFEKYIMWLMADKTNEALGQISPTLSPDGQDAQTLPRSDRKTG